MKLNVSVTMNLKSKEVSEKVKQAAKDALKDVVIDVANGAIKDSPYKTGNNRRSLAYQVPDTSEGVTQEGNVDGVELAGLQGAIYSTSGYGGYLETGTSKMDARPYIKPNVDKEFNIEKMAQKIKKNLGE